MNGVMSYLIAGGGNAGDGHGVPGIITHPAIATLTGFGGIYYAVNACVHLVRVLGRSARRDRDGVKRELHAIDRDFAFREPRNHD